MPALSVVRAANATFAPSYLPVALFVGGTSGIGQAMAEAFARYTKGNAHIIICGRNRTAAEEIIATFPKPTCEGAVHEFVPCDVSLVKNVHATTTELLKRLTRLNFLVLSPGFLSLKGRDETEEGIDKRMAVVYYARWKITSDLMPLLRKAKDEREDAKMITVLAAGQGCEIDLDDLGLKKNYSISSAVKMPATYSDLMIEEFAAREPGISFTHIYPGIVRTNIMKPSSWVLRPFYWVFYCLLYPMTVSPAVCAEHMLWALFNGKQGSYRRANKGDDICRNDYFGSGEARKRLWEHTAETVKV